MLSHMHLMILIAAMDCVVALLKHSSVIPDSEFAPLGLFLLFALGIKFLYSDRGCFSRKGQCCHVSKLRESVEVERRRSNELSAELAREREASASAAEETMAMILRLQEEKSSVELELRQYKRMAKERQRHDHQVIRSLQWLVLRRQSDEGDRACDGIGSVGGNNILEDFESVLYSSRDADSSSSEVVGSPENCVSCGTCNEGNQEGNVVMVV